MQPLDTYLHRARILLDVIKPFDGGGVDEVGCTGGQQHQRSGSTLAQCIPGTVVAVRHGVARVDGQAVGERFLDESLQRQRGVWIPAVCLSVYGVVEEGSVEQAVNLQAAAFGHVAQLVGCRCLVWVVTVAIVVKANAGRQGGVPALHLSFNLFGSTDHDGKIHLEPVLMVFFVEGVEDAVLDPSQCNLAEIVEPGLLFGTLRSAGRCRCC